MQQATIIAIEDQIRCRFRAAQAGRVTYWESPTIGTDRDFLSFYLAWPTRDGMWDGIAAHFDRRRDRIICCPEIGPADPGDASLPWIDVLLAQIPVPMLLG